MTLREKRRILYLLELLSQLLVERKLSEINPVLLRLFSRAELIEMAVSFYPKLGEETSLSAQNKDQLVELLRDHTGTLSYLIQQWKEGMVSVPKVTQEEVWYFLDTLQIGAHYLRDKPVESWDSYDVANYYSLLSKRGVIRRAFAIFTSDVQAEDVYTVTTAPSLFFDSQGEAEEELRHICLNNQADASEYVIHPLWRMV